MNIEKKINNILVLFFLNCWPLLLFVSQKFFVIPGYFIGFLKYSKKFYYEFFISGILVFFGYLIYFFQADNFHGLQHFLGFAFFILAIPLINEAVRNNKSIVFILSIFTILNSLFAFFIYILNVDLSSFKGLNRIIDDNGVVNRVYYESASLIAIFSISQLRNKYLKFFSYAIVFLYAILLAKSVFVILLYFLNYSYRNFVSLGILNKINYIIFSFLLVFLLMFSLSIFRPDIFLSLGAKYNQFLFIFNDDSSLIFGSGWGYYINEIFNSFEQPYQIEMQFPMLVRQIGIIGVLFYMIVLFLLIKSLNDKLNVAIFQFVIYILIGFNNPWLFMPSWYLTVVLMFKTKDKK